jgi:hypothetical protein
MQFMATVERMTTRAIAFRAIEDLPDETELDELLHRIIFLHALQRRIERADDEPTFTQEEIERQMAEWHD